MGDAPSALQLGERTGTYNAFVDRALLLTL